MPEHALHHLGEVLREQRRHRVGIHRLGQRGEAADVTEQDGHRALLAAEAGRFGRACDAGSQLWREVALEVAAHQRLAADAFGEL